MGMDSRECTPPPGEGATAATSSMTHTHQGEDGATRTEGQALPQEGYHQGPPPPHAGHVVSGAPGGEERRREHRPHPYMPSPHAGHQGDIPHIVIDPGEGGERRRPTMIPPFSLEGAPGVGERRLTVLTLAAKKQRAHSDSVLETHISGSGRARITQRQISSCSDAPADDPDDPAPMNLTLGGAEPPEHTPHQRALLDKPPVPFLWNFHKQSGPEAAGAPTSDGQNYSLRRHSDSTLPVGPDDVSTCPTRSLSTGDSGEVGATPPGGATYSQGVIHKRLKLKKYLTTRYQSSLQQEEEGTPPGDEPSPREGAPPARDFSLPRKPAPLSFVPQGAVRELARGSAGDSEEGEPEPDTPVFTPLDVFSPATPRSAGRDSEVAAHGGLRFRFSSFDHLNLSPGERGGSGSESGSTLGERGPSPTQMSVISGAGTERSMEEGSPGSPRSVTTPEPPRALSAEPPRPLILSPASHPLSPAPHSAPHTAGSPIIITPIDISPQGDPLPYPGLPGRMRAHHRGPAHRSPSSPQERTRFFCAPAPLSAPPYLSESPPEVSPYPSERPFPWAPVPQRDPDKGKVHFFPPEFFPGPAEMERLSALHARGLLDPTLSPHSSSPQQHARGLLDPTLSPHSPSPQRQQQRKYSASPTRASPSGGPPGKSTLSPITLASLEQQQPIASPYPSPITLKLEPGSPKPEGGGGGSRKVAQCQFTEHVLEQPLGTGGSGFVCPVCGQLFPSYNYLANHMVNHLPSEVLPKGPGDNNKIHLCKVCNRSFSRSDMLTRHMRLHTGLRPYECRVCGQVFSRSDHLHTHLRTHTGEKPYKCPQCPYAAPRRDMITRHLRIHTKSVSRRGRRAYSASAGRDDDAPRRGQSLSSLDSFESGEQSPGPGGPGRDDPGAYQRRPASLASYDSLESPAPTSATPSHASSFDFDPSEIPSDAGGHSPGFRAAMRRHEFPSASSLTADDAESRDTDTDIHTSFQKCTVGGGDPAQRMDDNTRPGQSSA